MACPHSIYMIIVFIIGYFFITIEHYTKVNKATVALLMAIACWVLQYTNPVCTAIANHTNLEHNVADVAQVVFFLFGALTVVEVINEHKGFQIIARYLRISSKKKMLWAISFISFFLSCILDNLTTTVVMITMIKKLIDNREERLLIGGAVVIAANAGGAWTPIGDVTTTMLWIGTQLSTISVIKTLFLPSLACMLVSCFCLSFGLKGHFPEHRMHKDHEPPIEPLGTVVLFLGIGLLIFVPVFKVLTGLPPFMGMLLALSILWLATDLVHEKYDDRSHLRVPNILQKIDFSGILFFLGILLCVGALYSAGLLGQLAEWLDVHVHNLPLIAVLIGFFSAVIDNVPLVAATMGMYSLELYPTDHSFWNMIAYCAGIGGSVLIIGSAAGVVFMGIEKVDFLWYVRRISLSATIGYLAGFMLYMYMQ